MCWYVHVHSSPKFVLNTLRFWAYRRCRYILLGGCITRACIWVPVIWYVRFIDRCIFDDGGCSRAVWDRFRWKHRRRTSRHLDGHRDLSRRQMRYIKCMCESIFQSNFLTNTCITGCGTRIPRNMVTYALPRSTTSCVRKKYTERTAL